VVLYLACRIGHLVPIRQPCIWTLVSVTVPALTRLAGREEMLDVAAHQRKDSASSFVLGPYTQMRPPQVERGIQQQQANGAAVPRCRVS
jgi:hypothetical protein